MLSSSKNPLTIKCGESPRYGKGHRDYKQPLRILHEQEPSAEEFVSGVDANYTGQINPTAPNVLVQRLSADFTDSDSDGMTDAAELKYGFDPNDPNSFPSEPAVISSLSLFLFPNPGSGLHMITAIIWNLPVRSPLDGKIRLMGIIL